MAGKFRLRGEQRKRPQNQHQRGKARRQQIQSKRRNQDEDDPHSSGNHRAGMIEFRIERQRPNRQQDESNVRVHQIAENLFFQRHAERHNELAGKLQSHFLPIESLKALAIDLPEKIVLARGHVIDQVLRERFLLGERLRLEHSAFSGLDIAPAFRRDRAHESRSIILDFALHLVVNLGRERPEQYGMRRARVGPGSHGRHVGRFQDEDSRRTRAAASRRHIEDHGNG